jgi:hypothetical protein
MERRLGTDRWEQRQQREAHMPDDLYPWIVIRDALRNVLESSPCPDSDTAAIQRLENAIELRRRKGYKVEQLADRSYRATSAIGQVELLALEMGPPSPTL